MNAKEYLSQARYLDARINSKIKQVEQLNYLATSATSVLSGMPHNPNKATSKMADIVGKIVDLQAEINHDIDTLVDLKRDIGGLIKSLPNVEHQTLLEKRYLCFQSWEQIAVDLLFSMQHTFRMHDSALKEIDAMMKDESKCD